MLIPGQKVKVYWNFYKKLFSVQVNDRVVAHLDRMYLSNVEFRVGKKGRERVRRNRRKNVHAKIHGIYCRQEPIDKYKLCGSITYNPYINDTFVFCEHPITKADYIELWVIDNRPEIQLMEF